MPVSPRITSYYNPRINKLSKIPKKPNSFNIKGSSRRTTPNAAHRKLKTNSTRGDVYKCQRRKKTKSLDAKTMLNSFIKSCNAIPPQSIDSFNPIRDNNQQLCIVVETRSGPKK